MGLFRRIIKLMCVKCSAQELVIHSIVLGLGRGWKDELKLEPTINNLKES